MSSPGAGPEKRRSWLAPKLVDDEPAARGPWIPPSLPRRAVGGLALDAEAPLWYIAVDELVDREAVLRVTPWPVLDDRGRLRFPQRDQGFVMSADADAFAELAAGGRSARTPTATASDARPLRVGDVFAARVRRPRRIDASADLADYVEGPLFDVSDAARESAKTQYLAAVGTVLSDDEVAELYRDRLAGLPDVETRER